jgi:hypothetical protein
MKLALSVIKASAGVRARPPCAAIDAFAHPFWNTVREDVADKAMEMRRQGFFGAAPAA